MRIAAGSSSSHSPTFPRDIVPATKRDLPVLSQRSQSRPVLGVESAGKGPALRRCSPNEGRRDLCREGRKENAGQRNKDEKAAKKEERDT